MILNVACTSTSPDYDADAPETNGRGVSRSVVGNFSRSVQPVGIDGTRAVGGYFGYILARRLFDQQTTVTLFEYTVALEGGRRVNVVREWGGDRVGDCVKVFESPSQRNDYPRMVLDKCVAQ